MMDYHTNLLYSTNIDKYIYFILSYMHVKRSSRVVYLLCMVIMISIYSLGREFFHLEILTGKYSIFNQIFVKIGWGWTLSLFVIFRICCLPFYPDWKQHLWKLFLRSSITTIVFYLWCQIVFPTIEDWTGYCVKQNIVVGSKISKVQCLKQKAHDFYAFDISGHSFLMAYCIFVLSEESKEFNYILYLKKLLFVDSHVNEKNNHEFSSKFSQEEFIYVEKVFKSMFPVLMLVFLLLFSLSILWDYMLIVTTIYYHTIGEKVVATLIAIFSWYFLYCKCFHTFDIL